MFLAKKSIIIAFFVAVPYIYGAAEPQQRRKSSILMVLSPAHTDTFGMLSNVAAAATHESAAAPQVFVPVKAGSASILHSDNAGSVAEGSHNHTRTNRTHGSQHRSRVNDSHTHTKHATVELNDQHLKRVSTGDKAGKVHSNAQSYSGNAHLTPSHKAQQAPAIQASHNNKSGDEKHNAEQHADENGSPTEMIMMFDTPQNEQALEKATGWVKRLLVDPAPIMEMAKKLNKTPTEFIQAFWITTYIKHFGRVSIPPSVTEAEALAKWQSEFTTPIKTDNAQTVHGSNQLTNAPTTAAAAGPAIPTIPAITTTAAPAPSGEDCCCVIL